MEEDRSGGLRRACKDARSWIIAGLGATSALVGLIPPVRRAVTASLTPDFMAALVILLGAVVVILAALVVSLGRQSSSTRHPAGREEARPEEEARPKGEARPDGDVGVIDALTWSDAVHAMNVLAGRLRQEFNPDLAIGIDRGGSIVAGVLAKTLGIRSSTIASSDKWMISSSELSLDDGIKDQAASHHRHFQRIVLVDDTCRLGGTMKAAIVTLQRLCETSVIRTAVILNERAYAGPGRPNRLGPGKPDPDYYVYWTKHADVLLPWDKPSPDPLR